MHREKSIRALAASGALFELSRPAPGQLTRLAVPSGVTAVPGAASTLETAGERPQWGRAAASQLSPSSDAPD